MNSRKILYIGGFELPDKNAAAHRVWANAKLLGDIGYTVSFIGPSRKVETSDRINGLSIRYVPYPSSVKEWIRYITIFVSIKEIQKFAPDYVILYNFPAIASLRILYFCHRHRIKVIHDVTEWETEQQWNLRSIIRRIDIALRMKYCIKKCDGVIAISKYLYDYYKNYCKTIYVPPTVDLLDAKWNMGKNLQVKQPVRMVYAGTAGVGQKDRLDLIIDEIVNVKNVYLDIIGMSKEQFEHSFEKTLERVDNISFHGRIPHEKALKAVQRADFQFLIRDNSLKNNAGFPTKLVESFACGTPVIATITSNIGDYLKDGFNCYIVSERKTLGDIISEISETSTDKILEMKRNCLEYRGFDYRNYIKEFEKLLSSI